VLAADKNVLVQTGFTHMFASESFLRWRGTFGDDGAIS